MIDPNEVYSKSSPNDTISRLEKRVVEKKKGQVDTLRYGLVSDLFDKEILTELEKKFKDSSFGYNILRADEFKSIIKDYIPPDLVENIYLSIDVNDVGYIKFSEFTNFLIASESGTSFSAKSYISRLVYSHTQSAENYQENHLEAIDYMSFVKRPDRIITGCRDGLIKVWDAENLEYLYSIDHKSKAALDLDSSPLPSPTIFPPNLTGQAAALAAAATITINTNKKIDPRLRAAKALQKNKKFAKVCFMILLFFFAVFYFLIIIDGNYLYDFH